MKLNGIAVKRVKDTIFMPLPRGLWTGGDGCSCGKCDGTGFWDTLAVSAKPDPRGRDFTWTVHYPELHARNAQEYRTVREAVYVPENL